MRRSLFIVLSVIVVSVASCARNQEKNAATEIYTLTDGSTMEDRVQMTRSR